MVNIIALVSFINLNSANMIRFNSIKIAMHAIPLNQGIKEYVIRDINLPSLYLNKNSNFDGNNIKQEYSVEHIYPKSLLHKKDHYDMHNLIRTKNYINNLRSNYKFSDKKNEETNNDQWIKLEGNNFLNKKDRIFIPNKYSKGIISRAIMYLAYNFNYDPYKIITRDNLIKWCIDNPPDYKEIYHNKLALYLQNTNNIFIENYNSTFYVDKIKKLF